jgi:hypothetical protein
MTLKIQREYVQMNRAIILILAPTLRAIRMRRTCEGGGACRGARGQLQTDIRSGAQRHIRGERRARAIGLQRVRGEGVIRAWRHRLDVLRHCRDEGVRMVGLRGGVAAGGRASGRVRVG